MAIVVPDDAYAEVSDVEARTLQTFSVGGSPSIADIEKFLRSGKERLDAALRREGAPFGLERTKALAVLLPINADFAAARVLAPQRERFDADLVGDRYREELKAILAGNVDLDEDDEDEETFQAFTGGRHYSG